MNRSSKFFRAIGGLLAMLNIVVAFLPLTIRDQVNYPRQNVSSFIYLKNLAMGRILPFGQDPMSRNQMIFLIVCVGLPLILALFAGIFGIFGDYKQVISIILSVIMMILFIVSFLKADMLLPEAAELDVTYSTGIAGMIFLILSILSVVCGVIGIICTPRLKPTTSYSTIPEVDETKEEQIKAKYSMIVDEDLSSQAPIPSQPVPAKPETAVEEEAKDAVPEIKPFVPCTPRGVLVGVKGIYEGAEIPMQDGESITFGRSVNNDLVFTDQIAVSRNHCRITWNQKTGTYLFNDHSSNGSFLYGSTDCLPSNIEIEIQAGTAIEIGDNTNVFRLS